MRIVDGTLLTVLALTATSVLAQSGEPVRDGRLKFRSGPPCMCNDGLSERAIREAERRNQQKQQERVDPGPKSQQRETSKGE
jgi:hypothetical protein